MPNDTLSDADVGLGSEMSDSDVGIGGFPEPERIPRNPLERAALNFQQAGQAAGAVDAGRLPIDIGGTKIMPTEGVQFPRVETPPEAGFIEKTAAGLYNLATGIPNFALSKEGIATALAPEIISPALAGPILKGVFGGLAAKQAGEALGRASVTGDIQDVTEGVGGAVLSPFIALHQSLPAKGLERATENQIKSTGGIPVEQQGVPIDRGTKGEAQGGTPQRSGEGEQAVPQPAEVQKLEPPPAAPAGAEPNVTPPVTQEPKGIAQKWATATDPSAGESGFINLDPIKEFVDKATPYVKSAFHLVEDVLREQGNLSKMDDYRKSVLNWSAKLQKSFGEAADAQKEINTKVPDPVRQEGITNWIQANGDPTVLANRLAATVDPKLRKGYEAALSLTPEEITVANDVRDAYNALGSRGNNYGVLKSFKDNYVTQIWDLGKGPVMGGSRTLRDKFRFSKASTFPTFFDGEQSGYTPKTKEIGKLLPTYLHEMNSVIAARQLVQQLSGGVAEDGRPLVAPRGKGILVDDPTGKATLIVPRAIKEGTEDYKTIPNQPALNDWRWAAKDDAGNPVFLKSDLALHPDAYKKLSKVLGKSAIREWYSTRTSATAQIPKLIVKGLDMANSGTKRTMLGLISPFHQVQEGTHAVGHRVNPFWSIPAVDLVKNPNQMDAAQHGLMLNPDRASANQFMEGLRPSGLVSKIPGIGPLADHYSDYLFHQYIPGLKFKTYESILERNRGVYADELKSGKVSDADVKHLSAEQANAAYGHINYTDLARSPTVQHILQLGALAPDFLEARARFAGQAIKGVTGAKVGREQLLALATLALAQAATAYTSAKISGGEWDATRPFEFHVGNRRYTMRSVPEDISTLVHDPRVFGFSRISPIIGKGVAQIGFGVDWRGQPITAGQTAKELLQQPIPINLRGFLGIGRQSLSGWEQLLSSSGIRVSRYSPATDMFDAAHKWMQSNPDPKIRKQLEQQQKEAHPESEYKTLRNALTDNNIKSAQDAYTELLKTKTPVQVRRALSHPHPFTGKNSTEIQFVRSLTPEQKKIYDQTREERRLIVERFGKLKTTNP